MMIVWLNRFVLLLVFVVCAVAVPAPQAEAAYGTITYTRFDWTKQSNGSYSINFVHCVSADNHAIGWGELSPSRWDRTQNYGYQNNCQTRLLFTGVNINDQMYTNIATNVRLGDADSEARFLLKRTGSSTFTCSLQPYDRNSLTPVSGRTCAWTKI